MDLSGWKWLNESRMLSLNGEIAIAALENRTVKNLRKGITAVTSAVRQQNNTTPAGLLAAANLEIISAGLQTNQEPAAANRKV